MYRVICPKITSFSRLNQFLQYFNHQEIVSGIPSHFSAMSLSSPEPPDEPSFLRLPGFRRYVPQFAPLRHYAVAPLRRCAVVPLCRCVIAPLCRCAIALLRHCAP